MSYASYVAPSKTPQSQPLLGKKQVKNSAGGYVYQISNQKRLERFLILGNESGTYYATAQKLTRENAQCVLDCYAENPKETIEAIIDIAASRRAAKQDPAVFALAMILADNKGTSVERLGRAVVEVCSTASTLFQFIDCFYELGGNRNSTQLKHAINLWYRARRDIPYQMAKYRQRNNWTHRDVLRKFHVKPADEVQNQAFRWAVGKPATLAEAHLPILAYEELKAAKDEAFAARVITDSRATWEMVPTNLLKSKMVWQALLNHMPYMAMLRNLGRMGAIDLLKPLSEDAANVAARLRDPEAIRKSGIHPFKILLAATTYASGHGEKGKMTWEPDTRVLNALDEAYVLSHKNVVPTGKRIMLALDVSGSMSWHSSRIMGTSITANQAAAAIALMTVKTEQNTMVTAFSNGDSYMGHSSGRYRGADDGICTLNFKSSWGIAEAVKATDNLPACGTDCALPMIYADRRKLEVDAFCLISDNETWCGKIHPCEALKQYRQKSGINAKLIVVGMTSSGFSIADPTDDGMLDVVGFDSNAPAFIADFIRGSQDGKKAEDGD